ncbi:MAG: iron-containing alcohol dehydrogenase, partial [Actinomycetota bacterium]|nr:iron-containing alcohol dehydrogenase [Actinomycetota bacterium]
KYGVGSRHLPATVALCDPELTVTLPPELTASTGMDALGHALECYVNRVTQPLSESLAIRALEMIARSLRAAVVWGQNIEARSEMLLASTMAAMAFNPTRLGIAHALAMPLGARHGIPHSVIISLLLPDVCDYNLIGALDKFAHIARLFGEPVEGISLREAAERGARAVHRLRHDLPLPEGLSAYGVEDKHLRSLAEEGIESGNIPVNPRSPTVEDLMEIMRRAL